MKTIQIPDMQSGHCQLRVRTVLDQVPELNVKSIKAVEVQITSNTDKQLKKVYAAVEKAGYTPVYEKTKESYASHQLPDETEYQFKTDLSCEGCVSLIAGDLDMNDGVCHWSADSSRQDKVLSVHSIGISENEIISILAKKGFKAEPVN